MVEKFMKINRLVLPFILVIILTSQLTGCGAGPKDTGSTYDYETNTVSPESKEESEIGLIESGDKADNKSQEVDEDNTQLYIAYQATYDSCISYTSTSLEDQLNKEVRDLKIIASGFATLPENYEEDYKAWRIENCGTGFTQASSESEAEAPVVEYGFTDADEMMYTTGTVNIRTGPGTSYDKIDSLPKAWSVHRIGIGTGTAEGWSLIEFEDGSTACVSSNYLSYTKPSTGNAGNNGGSKSNSQGSTYDEAGAQSGESRSEGNGIFGKPFNPKEGLTEEEIQQEIEDSYNTEFRVNGT